MSEGASAVPSRQVGQRVGGRLGAGVPELTSSKTMRSSRARLHPAAARARGRAAEAESPLTPTTLISSLFELRQAEKRSGARSTRVAAPSPRRHASSASIFSTTPPATPPGSGSSFDHARWFRPAPSKRGPASPGARDLGSVRRCPPFGVRSLELREALRPSTRGWVRKRPSLNAGTSPRFSPSRPRPRRRDRARLSAPDSHSSPSPGERMRPLPSGPLGGARIPAPSPAPPPRAR